MDNEQVGNVTTAWFTNDKTGETIELQAVSVEDSALNRDELMTLTWDDAGVAQLDFH